METKPSVMKKIYSLLAIMLTATIMVQAQTRTWVGPASGGSWTQANNWSDNEVPDDGDVVVINGGVTGNITNVPSIELSGLRIEENSTITFTVTGDREIEIRNSGSTTPRLLIETGSTLILEGNGNDDIELTITRAGGGGNIRGQIDGTLVLGTNSILDWNNGNTLVNITGAIENVDGNILVLGTTLQFQAGSFYRHQRNGSNIPDANWNASSTCEITGITDNDPGNIDQEFGHFTWNCPNQNAIINFDTDLEDVQGNFTMVSTGSSVVRLRSGGGGGSTLSVGGDFNLEGGTLVISNGSTQNMLVEGNVNISGGTLSRTGGTANFVFDNNGAQSFTKTGGSISGSINFRIDNNAEVDFGTSVLDGPDANFQLDSDAKIIVSHPDGLFSGTTTSGAIQVGGNRNYSDEGIYEFRGARTGTFSTNGNDVQSLIINNPAGEVLLERPFDVSDDLELLNGYATNDNSTIITVANGGSMSSANGGYVNGYLAKTQNSNATITFFVGSPLAGGLRPITLSNMAGTNTNTFTARFIRGNANTEVPNGTVLGPGLARVSGCEYWMLDRSGGGTRVGNVTIGWDPTSNCTTATNYVNNLSALRVARHDGARWVDEGGVLVGTPSTSQGEVISFDRVSAFSPFALASSSLTDNPLPVLFADVRAYAKNSGVQVEWSNLTERDILNYEVEHSSNGIDFTSINLQAPKSNRDDKASYDYFDAAPNSQTNYYRIRVQEVDGKVIYSKVLRVEMGTTKAASFSLYPNPVTGKQFTVSLNGLNQGRYQLEVYSTNGQRVYQTSINNVGAGVTQMVELPASLQTGLYVTVVSGDNYRESRQVLLR
jgi:hypothetical protein